MPAKPPPSALPPGMEVKFEDGQLKFSDVMPMGLRKMIEQAYEEGKLDDWVMAQIGNKSPATPQHDDFDELTPEEEALAEEFLAEQQAMEMCPFYLEGKCKYGSE